MNRPIRILFTIPNFITAGSGGAMLNIIKRLNRDLFDPAVCVLKKGGALDQTVLDLGIPLLEAPYVLNAKPYLSLYKRERDVARTFRPYQFDLWHSFHYADDYTEALVAYLSGAKGWIYTKKNMNWHSRAWQLRSLLAKRIAAQNTDMLKLFFSKPYYWHKMKLIPRGVDLKKFSPQPTTHSYYRQQFGIDDQEHLIGLVANLLPIKGHPTLIDALKQIQTAHVILAGKPLDQEYANGLMRQIADHNLENKVHFVGGIDNIPKFLSQMDIVIHSSIRKGEGSPVALLEAMACEKACVATNVPGSRDIIEDGVSGLLVEPENADVLAKAINRLIEDKDLREKMGEAARKRVETSFSIEREVAAHEQLYLELMGGKR